MEKWDRSGSGSRQSGRLSVYGSNGFGTVTAPGNDPYVLTVGASKAVGRPLLRPKGQPVTVQGAHNLRPRREARHRGSGNGIVSLAAQWSNVRRSYAGDLFPETMASETTSR